MKLIYLLVILPLLVHSSAYAQVIEATATYTHDSQFKRKEYSSNISQKFYLNEKQSHSLAVNLQSGYSDVERTSNDTSIIQVWDNLDYISQKSGGLNLTLDLFKRYGFSIGQNRGFSQINSDTTQSFGLYAWFLKETIQIAVNQSRTNSKQIAIDTIDRDAFRVITPTSIDGISRNINILALLSTTTIGETSFTEIKRSDRPIAKLYTLGGKQYFTAINGALHSKISLYENLGEIQPLTLQGQTIAQSIDTQWLQRVSDKYIVSVGYRAYFEDESPRAENADDVSRASDTIYGRLTFRNYENVWSHPATEYYAFGTNYKNSDGVRATSWGLGLRIN